MNNNTIEITINQLTGKNQTLNIHPTDTTLDIKQRIYNIWNYEPNNQKLIFCGKVLKDNQHPVKDENPPLKDGSMLHLILKQPPKQNKPLQPIKATIKLLTGRTITLIINPSDTTYDIKVKIQNAWEYKPDQQMLLFAGRSFKDNEHPLLDANPPLKDGSVIHLVLRNINSQNVPPKPVSIKPCAPYKFGQIFVKTLTGKTIALDVKSDDTIQDIKGKIQDKEGCNPSMQRLVFQRQNLCPVATLQGLGITGESTLHLVLKLGCGSTPPDSLLNGIYVESFCWWNLHQLIPIMEFDINLTKMIWNYSQFINLNVIKVHSKCMAAVGRSQRVDGSCLFCKGYKWEKPYINTRQIEQNLNENLLSDQDKGYDSFYGLCFKLEFKTYRSDYNDTWTIQTDVDSINQENIGKYIKITDKMNKISLPFELCDKGKTAETQFITVGIVENSLIREEIQKLFENGKLEINLLIHEKDLPVIYGGGLNDKGPIIGDVNLEYFIYRI